MRRTLSALLAVSAALAACGPVNQGVSTVKTPQFQTKELSINLKFVDNEIGPMQAAALQEFLAAANLGYGDRISLDDPMPFGAAARRAAVSEIVGRFGLLLADAGPVLPGALPAGTVRLVVQRSVAEVPNCPDWRRPSNFELAASTSSNFGCATQSNLAAMVADPQDLAEGRDYAGADGATVVKATEAFRRRTPTAAASGGALPEVRTSKSSQ
jgi:pilus assembly protein CpaD